MYQQDKERLWPHFAVIAALFALMCWFRPSDETEYKSYEATLLIYGKPVFCIADTIEYSGSIYIDEIHLPYGKTTSVDAECDADTMQAEVYLGNGICSHDYDIVLEIETTDLSQKS